MRARFPALQQRPGWVYLDSAATSLLPADVIEATSRAMAAGGSASRADHRAGSQATAGYEAARAAVAAHVGGRSDEVVFVRSATEGLNLIAQGWGVPNLRPGDRILVSALEHHSNLLPWRRTAAETGARVETVRTDARGDLDLSHLEELLSRRPRVLALTHVSNVTGACVPLAAVAARVRAHAPGCLIVVDGTQAIPHLDVDVRALGADFYVFSGHKAYGPPGAGVVWGAAPRWQQTAPLLLGGGTVSDVRQRGHTLVEAPWRFEAGTPNHIAAVGLAAGLSYCGGAPGGLASEAAAALAALPGCRVLGDPVQRVGCVSWTLAGIHPHDAGTLLDVEGVAVRSGHMCAQPYLEALGANAALRASFGAYSTPDDVRRLIEGVRTVQSRLGGLR